MNFNKGKYEPTIVKETIQGKEIKCNINGIYEDTISLIVGNDFVFKILFATFDIDAEGYYWDLSVSPVNISTGEFNVEKMKSCLITDLDVIDNFYEQCN